MVGIELRPLAVALRPKQACNTFPSINAAYAREVVSSFSSAGAGVTIDVAVVAGAVVVAVVGALTFIVSSSFLSAHDVVDGTEVVLGASYTKAPPVSKIKYPNAISLDIFNIEVGS
jgi:hypothetical protein